MLVGDIFRPNLQLAALRARDDDERIHRLVDWRLPERVRHCHARLHWRCEEVAEVLRGRGIQPHCHAGIDSRDEVQDRFMRGEVSVIVATVALVWASTSVTSASSLHDELPNSVGGYYRKWMPPDTTGSTRSAC